MDDKRLTEELARQLLGWRTVPGRFLKSGRSWIPTWRFAPLKQLEHAFQLLDGAASDYTLSMDKRGIFTAEVRAGGRIGKASGQLKARVITTALGRALGLGIPDEMDALSSVPLRRRRQHRGSKINGT